MEIKMRLGTTYKVWHAINDSNYYHREDGPAIIWNDGCESWWYYNKKYLLHHMPLNLFLNYCKWEYNKNVSH